ncbi:RHS repeat-associated core domain-containing protein [Streptacidiphilus sp. MAP12-20]|uniref:RHS repeat-associated core domain-containing protein n=1 Tax=Streptacidiphilus sp. MAP12-20 TaxID=3156299 RepID=UPI003514D160
MTRSAALAVTAALLAAGTAVIAPATAAKADTNSSSTTTVTSRPDAYAAMMAAKKQGSAVEVLDDRTDASQTFANPDGTFTYNTFAQPKWVKQAGAWKDLDPTLVKGSNGAWSPALSESSLVLSGGGTGPLATMTVDGKQLGLTWPSALPTPTASGATLTYPNVLASGVDLQVTATAAGGVEETLVIKNATAAADPALADLTQTVNSSNGTVVSADAGGNLTDTTTSGSLLVNAPAPVMWDSATTTDATATPSDSPTPTPTASATAGGTQAGGLARVMVASLAAPGTHSTAHTSGSHAHQRRVKATFTNHKLHLAADTSLLTAKSTVYPVFEDPAFVPHPTSGATLHWDEVQQAYPTTSNYDAAPGSGLAVGYQGFSSPTGIERTYYNLSVPSSIYGSTVISASLNTTVTYAAASGSNTDTVNVYSTCAITASTTWNAQPCHDSSVNPNYPNPVVAKSFTTTSQSPNLAVSFNVQPSMQLLANGSHNNWTVGLYNSTETNDVNLIRFADNPTFSITYNNPPATPTNLSVSPSNVVGSTTYTSTGKPTLSASATDANSDTVQYSYQILSGSTVKASGTTAFVNSGTAATWAPSTALADGAYTWQVRAYDGHDYSAWTTAKAFTIDSTTPAAPTVNCPSYPANTWTAAISGGVTCTLSDTATDLSGYAPSLDSGIMPLQSSTSLAINPGNGLHTLTVKAVNNAGTASAATTYVFGVGGAALVTPVDQQTTSNTVQLQASSPPGTVSAQFYYRVGTNGSFVPVPVGDVTNSGASVTWPVAVQNVYTTGTLYGPHAMFVMGGSGTVTSEVTPLLTWNMAHSLNTDGLVQVEAVFTDSNNNTVTTPAVNVTLDRLGTGTDFGTTQAGPVTVGLQSGNASVSANDVNISSYGSGLSVDRTFNSLNPTVNTGFGPGWTTSLPTSGNSWASVTDDGTYAQLTGQDGSKLTFAAGAASNGTTPYTGQGPAAVSGLTLTKNSTGFTLTDTSGVQVTFALPTGGVGGLYLPTTVTQPGSAKSTGYIYDPNNGPTQGKLMLMVAPNAATSTPNTTACPYPATNASWAAGCRGLQFGYDSTTGNINEVDLLTTDGTTLTTTPVAKYTYDASGRLATEWDPRISPALATTYSYDENGTADPDNGRLTQISPAQSTVGTLAPWVLAYNDTATSADYGKLASVTRTHNAANGGGTAKTVVAYSVPLTTAAGGPANMDWQTTATWGQTDVPASAVAIFPADHAPTSTPPTDWTYAQILYYDANGKQVNTASYNNGWNIATTEYDKYGNTVRSLTAGNRATALAAGSTSATVAAQLDTQSVYSSDGTGLTDTYGPAHQAMAAGSIQTIRTHVHQVYDQGAPNSDKDANGNPYHLVTSQTVTASLGSSVPGSSDVDGRTTQSIYNNGSDNEGWTLRTALQTVTDPGTGHLNITKTIAYNENSGLYGGEPLQISSSQPSDTAGTGTGTTKTVYYTAGSNSADSACGNQPAWTDLICKTEPAAQPGTAGLASLPVTQFTYNTYLSPLTTTRTYTAADGSTSTRTTTASYDGANRQIQSGITTTGTGMGAAVAPTKTVYDVGTGLATDTQSLDSGGAVTADLKTTYDDWGQASTYTDGSGQVTSYAYDLAGRPVSRSDSTDTVTLVYNGGSNHTGQLTGETDTKAGSFSYSYGANGSLSSWTYPGGTTGTLTVDSTGTNTTETYTNSSWSNPLSDSIVRDATDDWVSRTTLASNQSYVFDAADRLSTVADTQAGQCTTRTYSYDANSNRTGLTSGAPNADGTCQTTTTSTNSHTYDSADRITDTGFAYDTQGNVTTTPSAYAGGIGDLSATYFSNNMVASQTQAGDTITWALDPEGNRTLTQTDSSTGSTTTNHFADNSDSPDLITDATGGWTRLVTGPIGLLAQVTATATMFELRDLHGNVLADINASDNSVAATHTYSEFGAAETGPAQKYGWLGVDLRSGGALGGQVLMGARVYNPYTGRFSQVDPVTGGSANSYDYTNQNPINQYDLTGQYSEWCSWDSGIRWGGWYDTWSGWQASWWKSWIIKVMQGWENIFPAEVQIDGLQTRWGYQVQFWVEIYGGQWHRSRQTYYWYQSRCEFAFTLFWWGPTYHHTWYESPYIYESSSYYY